MTLRSTLARSPPNAAALKRLHTCKSVHGPFIDMVPRGRASAVLAAVTQAGRPCSTGTTTAPTTNAGRSAPRKWLAMARVDGLEAKRGEPVDAYGKLARVVDNRSGFAVSQGVAAHAIPVGEQNGD